MGRGHSDAAEVIDPEKVLSIMGNPNKRRIIVLLGERGRVSFSEMRRELKMSVGNLYYNLDGLAGFVTKDKERKYMLTPAGEKLYKILIEETQRINYMFKPKQGLHRIMSKYIIPVFFPSRIFTFFYRNYGAGVPSAVGVLIVAAALYSMLGLDVTLLEVHQKMLTTAIEPLYILAKITASYFIIGVLVEFLSRAFGSERESWDLLIALAVALSPLYLAYPLVKLIMTNLVNLGQYVDLVNAIVLRLCQLFTITFIATCIHIYKRIGLERGFVISTILYYLSYFTGIASAIFKP